MKQYKTFTDLKQDDNAYLLTFEYNRWVIKELNVFDFNEKYLETIGEKSLRILVNKQNSVYIDLTVGKTKFIFADFQFLEDIACIMCVDVESAIKNFKNS